MKLVVIEIAEQGSRSRGLENRCTGSRTGGSNPSPSATQSATQRNLPSFLRKSREIRMARSRTDTGDTFSCELRVTSTQGLLRWPRRFVTLNSEATALREASVATVDGFAFLFSASVERTAASVCCRESNMEFLETRRTMGSTIQRSATGTSRLRAIASTST